MKKAFMTLVMLSAFAQSAMALELRQLKFKGADVKACFASVEADATVCSMPLEFEEAFQVVKVEEEVQGHISDQECNISLIIKHQSYTLRMSSSLMGGSVRGHCDRAVENGSDILKNVSEFKPLVWVFTKN